MFLSLPARSIIVTVFYILVSLLKQTSCNIAWEREESLLMLFDEHDRIRLPFSISVTIYYMLIIYVLVS